MPFIPHTPEDTKAMLAAIGKKHLEDLFSEIPEELKIQDFQTIPEGTTELALMQETQKRLKEQASRQCFIGAGAYEHHIPAAVWDITMRGEYLTSYTPYQAEASQGTLQLLWEYQTMMASLMGLEVSNASLYDGASSLGEAILMAIRLQPKEAIHHIWVPQTLHPYYREVLSTLLVSDAIKLVDIPYDSKTGTLSIEALDKLYQDQTCQVLVIPSPNFFGQLEKINELTNWAHEKEALVVGVVNPFAMAWLKPPGEWGKKGADIACGEGQPLGVPLSGGGPFFGFLCSRLAFVRQMPGRIVGQTVDVDGQPGFTLTLQAREQHIRRGKATSNICTNQGLMVTAATIYLSLMGPKGLKALAQTCHHNMQLLIDRLQQIAGVKKMFQGSYFHETVFSFDVPVTQVVEGMQKAGIHAGFILDPYYPGLKNALLVCVTETKTAEDITNYAKKLDEVLSELRNNA